MTIAVGILWHLGKRLGRRGFTSDRERDPGAIVCLPGERMVSTVNLEIEEDQIVTIRAPRSREVAAREGVGITRC